MAALVGAGLGLTPLLALASLLPASRYGEGLRRAFVSVADPRGESGALVGWRGRLLLLPLLAPAPALLLSILLALPLTRPDVSSIMRLTSGTARPEPVNLMIIGAGVRG